MKAPGRETVDDRSQSGVVAVNLALAVIVGAGDNWRDEDGGVRAGVDQLLDETPQAVRGGGEVGLGDDVVGAGHEEDDTGTLAEGRDGDGGDPGDLVATVAFVGVVAHVAAVLGADVLDRVGVVREVLQQPFPVAASVRA